MPAVVAVVHATSSGATRRLAHAVVAGASLPDVTAWAVSTEDIGDDTWVALDEADAVIFGSPTLMGAVSAPFKAFMEASGRVYVDGRRWDGKLAAGFTVSAAKSGDKLATLQQLALFAAHHGMVWVSLGLDTGWASASGRPDDTNRLGSYLGAMAAADFDAPPDAAPPEPDLRTAAFLGRRVATMALHWKAPRD